MGGALPHDSFQFKRFSVSQNRCGMKVGTDGILLGALATVHHPRQILDIGTGTGLVALMLAQRTEHCSAKICGVEVDSRAAVQATENFAASPWWQRLNGTHQSLADFAENFSQPPLDLIVCNPPYFSGTPPIREQRRRSRYAMALQPEQLLQSVGMLLDSRGHFGVILPAAASARFLNKASGLGFYLRTLVEISPLPTKPPKRCFLEFGRLSGTPTLRPQYGTLTIAHRHHQYTSEFRRLTEPFYLERTFASKPHP